MLRGPLRIYDNSNDFSTTAASCLPVLSKYGVLVAEDVAQERELLDGSGYPEGLKGNDISRMVRIVSVADIYEALIAKRPYKSS